MNSQIPTLNLPGNERLNTQSGRRLLRATLTFYDDLEAQLMAHMNSTIHHELNRTIPSRQSRRSRRIRHESPGPPSPTTIRHKLALCMRVLRLIYTFFSGLLHEPEVNRETWPNAFVNVVRSGIKRHAGYLKMIEREAYGRLDDILNDLDDDPIHGDHSSSDESMDDVFYDATDKNNDNDSGGGSSSNGDNHLLTSFVAPSNDDDEMLAGDKVPIVLPFIIQAQQPGAQPAQPAGPTYRDHHSPDTPNSDSETVVGDRMQSVSPRPDSQPSRIAITDAPPEPPTPRLPTPSTLTTSSTPITYVTSSTSKTHSAQHLCFPPDPDPMDLDISTRKRKYPATRSRGLGQGSGSSASGRPRQRVRLDPGEAQPRDRRDECAEPPTTPRTPHGTCAQRAIQARRKQGLRERRDATARNHRVRTGGVQPGVSPGVSPGVQPDARLQHIPEVACAVDADVEAEIKHGDVPEARNSDGEPGACAV